MLRSCLNNATKVSKISVDSICSSQTVPDGAMRPFRSYSSNLFNITKPSTNSLLGVQDVNLTSVRTKMDITRNAIEHHRVFNFDRRTGERTSCDAVTKRFMRLRWGAWIRTIAQKPANEIRFKKHVFCNAQQSRLLDKMAGGWYMKPHYYVDDPYEPYHKREEYLYTRRKPVPPRD